MDDMTREETEAYEWATTQRYTSVSASYARLLAVVIGRKQEQVTRLTARLEQHRGALGYAVSGDVPDDPDIRNGLADAIAIERNDLRMRVASLTARLAVVTSILRIETCDCGGRPDPNDVPLDNTPGHHDWSCPFRKIMQPAIAAEEVKHA
jgi:hypothetical protein